MPGHASCPNVGSALLSVGSSPQMRDAALTHYKVDRPGRYHGKPGIPVITPSVDVTCPPIEAKRNNWPILFEHVKSHEKQNSPRLKDTEETYDGPRGPPRIGPSVSAAVKDIRGTTDKC